MVAITYYLNLSPFEHRKLSHLELRLGRLRHVPTIYPLIKWISSFDFKSVIKCFGEFNTIVFFIIRQALGAEKIS